MAKSARVASVFSLFILVAALHSGLAPDAYAAEPPPDVTVLKGNVSVWSREACASETEPCLPQPIGKQVPVGLSIRKSSESGAHIILKDTVYVGNNWAVEIVMVQVNPVDGSKPYIVTSTKLKEAVLRLVAECTRYDAVDAFSFLPPGSCAGRNGAKTYGVSFAAP